MECPTIRIKATTGSYPFTTINEADFDPATQELYVEGEPLPDIKSDAEAQAALESAADDIAATTALTARPHQQRAKARRSP